MKNDDRIVDNAECILKTRSGATTIIAALGLFRFTKSGNT
jgi:hypothetical protein